MKVIPASLAATASTVVLAAAASTSANSKTAATTAKRKKPAFQMLVVCERDHYRECEEEIERFEGIEITNYMIHTPNMFAAKLASREEEDPLGMMESVKALPHVANVEEDHVIKVHRKPMKTDKKVSKEDLAFENDRIGNKKGILSNILKDAKIARRDNDDNNTNNEEGRKRKLHDISNNNRNRHQQKDLQERFERRARRAARRELQTGTLPTGEQTIPYGIYQVNAVNFWPLYGKGSGAKVCVLDSGVIDFHEDLESDKLDGSGGNSTSLPYAWFDDFDGHGTHVAGTVAAADNGIGVVGVAPEADIHAIQLYLYSDDLDLYTSVAISALDECDTQGADVVNMSFGQETFNNQFRLKVDEKIENGMILIAAAGNDGEDTNGVLYPAGFDGVVSVGASDVDGFYTDFTTFNTDIDISAPGEEVLSLDNTASNLYSIKSGTSMASPHVAGVAALLKSAFPTATGDEIVQAMKDSAVGQRNCGRDARYGHGHVDAVRAAALLSSGSTENQQTSPPVNLAACKDIELSIDLDLCGSEIFWMVFEVFGDATVPDAPLTLVPIVTGGPYLDDLATTVVEDIGVPDDGCYAFAIIDSYGDGLVGEAGFIVSYGDFSHASTFEPVFDNTEIVMLGCDGNTVETLPSPVFEDANPGFVYTGQFNVRNGGDPRSCPTDQIGVVLNGTMDRYAGDENSMVLLNRKDIEDSSQWLWNFYSFENYEEVFVGACLDPNECYIFAFFDSFADGLLSEDSEGLTMWEYRGGEIFTMPPDTPGGGDDPTSWIMNLGTCFP